MLGGDSNREKMAVFKFEDYDEEEADVITLYLVSPRRVPSNALGPDIEAASICTCHERESALAIAEAWNAYYIKN